VSDATFLLVTFGPMVTLLLLGVSFPFAMGLGGLCGAIFGLDGNLYAIRVILWNVASNPAYLSVGLFLLMAEILVAGGVSKSFYSAAAAWLSRVPGGLLHVNIVASTVFAAASGSSAATAAAFGKAAHVEGQARGYPTRLNMGSLAGGATLGILIPPSVPMIVYAIITETSIADLFAAGVIPGIVASAGFMAWIYIRSVLRPDLLPRETRAYTWRQCVEALAGVVPWVLLVGGVLGMIYAGVMTPTEAAAVGVAIAFVLAVGYRAMSWPMLMAGTANAARVTSMVVLLLVSGSLLSYVYTTKGVTDRLVALVVGSDLPGWLILAISLLGLVILGCVLDTYSIIVLTVPLLAPVMTRLGYDLIWFGVLVTICVETGLITPPFGINLFILDGVLGGGQIEEVARGTIPYLIILLLLIALVVFVPGLALWLPGVMRQ
jgi:tripartite ATP-independent transporter DctM subunit